MEAVEVDGTYVDAELEVAAAGLYVGDVEGEVVVVAGRYVEVVGTNVGPGVELVVAFEDEVQGEQLEDPCREQYPKRV